MIAEKLPSHDHCTQFGFPLSKRAGHHRRRRDARGPAEGDCRQSAGHQSERAPPLRPGAARHGRLRAAAGIHDAGRLRAGARSHATPKRGHMADPDLPGRGRGQGAPPGGGPILVPARPGGLAAGGHAHRGHLAGGPREGSPASLWDHGPLPSRHGLSLEPDRRLLHRRQARSGVPAVALRFSKNPAVARRDRRGGAQAELEAHGGVHHGKPHPPPPVRNDHPGHAAGAGQPADHARSRHDQAGGFRPLHPGALLPQSVAALSPGILPAEPAAALHAHVRPAGGPAARHRLSQLRLHPLHRRPRPRRPRV